MGNLDVIRLFVENEAPLTSEEKDTAVVTLMHKVGDLETQVKSRNDSLTLMELAK